MGRHLNGLWHSCKIIRLNFKKANRSILLFWLLASHDLTRRKKQITVSSFFGAISKMEACLTRCYHKNAFFRAFKPFNLEPFYASFSCSSMPVHSGGGTKSLKKAYDALLLDAGGTLLQLPHPVEETYASIGRKYGLGISSAEIKSGFKRAFSAPWPKKLRYQGDARPFWKFVVSEATGCTNHDYFEELYEYFANGDAWRLPDEAYDTLSFLKDCGVRLAVVSNFDTRLRKLLKDLNVIDLFDALIISSEVGYEKPDPNIFKAALDQLNVEASKAVHIGDDLKADKDGANAVGVECWLWGADVKTFRDLRTRIVVVE